MLALLFAEKLEPDDAPTGEKIAKLNQRLLHLELKSFRFCILDDVEVHMGAHTQGAAENHAPEPPIR